MPSLPYEIYVKIIERENAPIGWFTYQYQNPYLIYENTSSKNSIGLIEKLNNMDIPEIISSFYVPLILFDALDFDFENTYYDFAYSYVCDFPIIYENTYFDSNYHVFSSLENQYIEFLEKLQRKLVN